MTKKSDWRHVEEMAELGDPNAMAAVEREMTKLIGALEELADISPYLVNELHGRRRATQTELEITLAVVRRIAREALDKKDYDSKANGEISLWVIERLRVALRHLEVSTCQHCGTLDLGETDAADELREILEHVLCSVPEVSPRLTVEEVIRRLRDAAVAEYEDTGMGHSDRITAEVEAILEEADRDRHEYAGPLASDYDENFERAGLDHPGVQDEGTC